MRTGVSKVPSVSIGSEQIPLVWLTEYQYQKCFKEANYAKSHSENNVLIRFLCSIPSYTVGGIYARFGPYSHYVPSLSTFQWPNWAVILYISYYMIP